MVGVCLSAGGADGAVGTQASSYEDPGNALSHVMMQSYLNPNWA